MISILAFKLVLALLFGAAVGLEREIGQPQEGSAGGMRTYALIAFLGAISGILYINNLLILSLAVTVCFFCDDSHLLRHRFHAHGRFRDDDRSRYFFHLSYRNVADA